MFGLTVKVLETSKEYSVEELYEAIKDVDFSAGKPEYFKEGVIQLILFPEIDRYNQLRIAPAQVKKAPYTKFTVCKGCRAGIRTKVENKLLSKLTQGAASIFCYIGYNVRYAERLVVVTSEEFNKLGL